MVGTNLTNHVYLLLPQTFCQRSEPGNVVTATSCWTRLGFEVYCLENLWFCSSVVNSLKVHSNFRILRLPSHLWCIFNFLLRITALDASPSLIISELVLSKPSVICSFILLLLLHLSPLCSRSLLSINTFFSKHIYPYFAPVEDVVSSPFKNNIYNNKSSTLCLISFWHLNKGV